MPRLANESVELREPRPSDATALVTALDVADFSFLDEPSMPPTLAGLAGFIDGLPARRASGALACWAIVPTSVGVPVGLIVVRGMDPAFSMVEVTAVIAAEYRGTGLFAAAAPLALECLFGAMGVHRLEARVDVSNARAHGALRKVGACQEGVLRQARLRDGRFRDHVLWAMVAEDWHARSHSGLDAVH